jgi:hypothetical protein
MCNEILVINAISELIATLFMSAFMGGLCYIVYRAGKKSGVI